MDVVKMGWDELYETVVSRLTDGIDDPLKCKEIAANEADNELYFSVFFYSPVEELAGAIRRSYDAHVALGR